MIRVFLLLLVLSSVCFAQSEEAPKPVKFDEFEKATNGNVKMRMDAFHTELENNPQSQGYVINYGTDREIAIRERQLQDAIAAAERGPLPSEALGIVADVHRGGV